MDKIKELHNSLDELKHRTEVENEAIRLIEELKFDKANKLLDTLK